MSLTAKVRSYCSSLLQRSQRESEISEEIAFHLEARAADLELSGLSPKEALRRAKIEFGGVETHRAAIRSSLGLRWIDELGGDLRYAWRMLWRSKAFTAIAIGSLALGIGANTTIFTLTKSVLLNRIVVSHPEQLRLIALVNHPKSPGHGTWNGQVSTADGGHASASISYPIYQELLRQNREDANSPLQDIVGFQDAGTPTITVDGRADVVRAVMVSGNFYQQMEVLPQIGRAIQPSDDIQGAAPVVVISDSLWERKFARSASVLGKTVHLNLVPYTVVGVNPAGYTGPITTQVSPDVFVPLTTQPILIPIRTPGRTVIFDGSLLNEKRMWWVETEARLKPGANEAAALLKLQTWMERDIRSTTTVATDAIMPKVVLVDGSRGIIDKRRGDFTIYQELYVLSGLAAFVLLLACTNLANLLLARSTARQREMGVRLALGASRGRVLRQVFTESLLLSGLGGIVGLALGYATRNVIPHLLSPAWETPNWVSHFDGSILLFTAGISILTGLLFGVAPAWMSTRSDVNGSLKESSLAATRRRKGFTGRALVALQVALSMILVVGAGLFATTLKNLNATQLGFRPENIVLFALHAPDSRYQAPADVKLHERVEDRLKMIPGVQAVSAVWMTPVSRGQILKGFHPMDLPKESSIRDGISYNSVGQDFFSLYSIPILAGRGFDASDSETSAPVAVINQAAAKLIYHDANPVGRRFQEDEDGSGPAKDASAYQIIGVAGDAKYAELQSDAPATVYMFYRQNKRQEVLTYAVKTAMPAKDLLPQIQAAVAAIDRDLPLLSVRTQVDQIAQTTSQERLLATLTSCFGVLALVLACIGIYGLMAYDVARRTSEIGIRMALGARASQMLSMVLREASWMAAAGIVAGLGGALLLTKYVKAMLFGIAPNDPWVMGGAAALLFAVALIAGFAPARRAARVEPMVALRHE